MDTRKIMFFQYTALFLLLAAIPLVYSARSYNLIQIKEALFAVGAAVFAFFLFFARQATIKKEAFLAFLLPAWFVISVFFSPYKYAGIYPVAAAAVLLMFYFSVAVTEWEARKIRMIISLSAVPVIIIGLVQLIAPAAMKEFMVFGARVPATLGNPNFFSAYLAGIAPVPLAGLMDEKGKKRVFYAVVLAALAFCLIATGSKAAVIGFIFIFSWPYFIFMKKTRDVRKNLVILACLTAVVLTATVAVTGYGLSKTQDKAEWAKNESVFFRAYTWLGTLGIIGQNPAVGTGPGTFAVEYPEYRRPEIMLWTHEHSYETTQPENVLLQLAAETGVPGVLIFIFLLAVLIRNTWQERNEYLAGILSILIINLVAVDINYITSSMLVALYGGIIMSGTAGKTVVIGGWKKNACVAAAIACMAAAASAQFIRHSSLVYLKQGEFFSRAGQWDGAIDAYTKALEKDRYNLTARYYLANSYMDSGNGFDKALEEYGRLEKLAPDYVLLHYRKAQAYNYQGAYDLAVEEYVKMLGIDPYFKPALLDLAHLYFSKKQMAGEAEKLLKKALEKYPEDPAIYNNLGNIYFLSNRPDESIEAFKKAVDLKADKDYYYNLGCVYFTMNDVKNADFYLKKALETAPGDVKIEEMLGRVKRYKSSKGAE